MTFLSKEIKNFIASRLKKLSQSKLSKIIFTKDTAFFLLITILFLSNAFHEFYPDEYDNLFGGKLILQGDLPYKNFMSHHGPVAYYLAALIQIFSGNSFVKARILYSILLSILLFFAARITKLRFNSNTPIKTFSLLAGISLMYFWLHMLLADTLSAFLYAIPYIYLLSLDLGKKKLVIKDVFFINIFLFLALFTSLSYAYLIILTYLYLAWLWLSSNGIPNRHKLIRIITTVAAPYLLYFLFLLLTNSTKEYYFQNIVFNREYYISDYPLNSAGEPINPIRYAVYLAGQTVDSAVYAIQDALRFNPYDPVTVSLMGVNTALVIYLIIKKRALTSVFIFAAILFANSRAKSVTVTDTGYQQAVYVLLSLANASILIGRPLLKIKQLSYKHFLIGFTLVFNIYYVAIYVASMLSPYSLRVYSKIMGEAPIIYDRPEVAPTINLLLEPQDYAWIGPYSPDELYYLETQLPSKHFVVLPAQASSPKIVTEMMQDFMQNDPKIISFDTGYFGFGQNPRVYSKFMFDYLDANFTLISEIKNDKGQSLYKCNIPTLKDFRCDRFLFINNLYLEEIPEKMLKLGLIEKI